jgi:hypothetical protein
MIQKGDVVRVRSDSEWSDVHGKLGLVTWDTRQRPRGMVTFFDGSTNGADEGWYLELSELEKVDEPET